ncbi:MAG: hypothetical protein JSW61_00925, partial [Candidatus Thorarchaeota archaeon]
QTITTISLTRTTRIGATTPFEILLNIANSISHCMLDTFAKTEGYNLFGLTCLFHSEHVFQLSTI